MQCTSCALPAPARTLSLPALTTVFFLSWHSRYLPDVTGDGLVNQINNPEVEVDISRPDLPTRQQVLALRIATSRLVGACHGQDIDFQDTGEVPPQLPCMPVPTISDSSLKAWLVECLFLQEWVGSGRASDSDPYIPCQECFLNKSPSFLIMNSPWLEQLTILTRDTN